MNKVILLMLIIGYGLGLVQTSMAAPSVRVHMRTHGYHLGDVVNQTVYIQLAQGQAIDQHSLPLPGPIKPWLDLRHIQVSQQGQLWVLHLQWQLFATVENAQVLQLPAFQCKLLESPASLITVPASAFYYSPVLGSQVSDIERLPTHPAIPYPLSVWQGLTWLSLCLSVGLAVLALWMKDALPWWPFRPGPLLSVARAQASTEPAKLAALLYQALCRTAGRTLHADNVPALFYQAPWLQMLQPEITGFVQAYLQQQYGYQPLQPALAQTTPAQLDMAWLSQAAMLERLQRRLEKTP